MIKYMASLQSRKALYVAGTVCLLFCACSAQFTSLGCILEAGNTKCNGNGTCERTGLCTCYEGYHGDNCEVKITSTFKKEGLGKGFIAGWTIFWILLNVLLPILIFLMIKYLSAKNCDTLKTLYTDFLDAWCCCFRKGNQINLVVQDEERAAVVLREPAEPQPNNKDIRKEGEKSTPRGAQTTAKPGEEKLIEKLPVGKKEKSKLPEDVMLMLLQDDPKQVKWTKKEAAPIKKAFKGLQNLLKHEEFNLAASLNSLLDAQEKIIKEKGLKRETKVRTELETAVPTFKSSGMNLKAVYATRLKELERELAGPSTKEVTDVQLVNFVVKAEGFKN